MSDRPCSWSDLPLVLDLGEVASVIGVSKSSAWRLVRDGRIQATRISSRRIVISKASVQRFVGDAQEAGGAVAATRKLRPLAGPSAGNGVRSFSGNTAGPERGV